MKHIDKMKSKCNMILTGLVFAMVLIVASPTRGADVVYIDEPLADSRPAVRQIAYPSNQSAYQPNLEYAVRDQVVRTAVSLIGVPYRRGGNGEYGFDCSGFVNRALSTAGFRAPRNSRDFYRRGVKITLDQAHYGDLLFFEKGGRINHVGIYLGDGRFIHSSVGNGVAMSNINSPYYRSHYAGVTALFSYPMTTVF